MSEEPNEYQRLLRFICDEALAPGLYLARYEHAVLARQQWTRAAKDAGASGRRVEIVDFGEADDEVDMLARMGTAAQADLVFVVGLERLLVELGQQPRRTGAIASLNFSRDRIAERVGKAIVFWMSYRAARAFALVAPDTFDILRSTFEFPETIVAAGFQPTHDTLPDWLRAAPPEERAHLEERAQLLESLHQDAQPGTASAADLGASLARVEFALGHHEAGLEWSEQAARDYEVVGDLAGAATLRRRRAEMLVDRGELDAALDEVTLAIEVADRSGSATEKIEALQVRADVLMRRGEFDAALELLEQGVLPACAANDDELRGAWTMSRVARILQMRGDLDEALRIHREELPIYERLDDDRSRAVALGDIARILTARGDLDGALLIYQRDRLPLYEHLGDVRGKAATLGQIAGLLWRRGESDAALRIYREQELPIYKHLGDPHLIANTAGRIADIHQARGELDEALRLHLEDALPIYEQQGNVRDQAATMEKVASIMQTRGHFDEALRIRREQVLPVYERIGDVRATLIAQTKLAQNLIARGRREDRTEAIALMTLALATARDLRIPEQHRIAELLTQARAALPSPS